VWLATVKRYALWRLSDIISWILKIFHDMHLLSIFRYFGMTHMVPSDSAGRPLLLKDRMAALAQILSKAAFATTRNMMHAM
jgi:hypothetical protein